MFLQGYNDGPLPKLSENKKDNECRFLGVGLKLRVGIPGATW